MQLARALPLALIAALSACLEVEEEVDVRPDGSVRAVVSAKGDRVDLEDGFPLPTWGAWRAANPAALAWVSGGALEGDSPELAFEAELRSVGDLPIYFAPPAEPYRSAHLERRTELEVLHQGGRTVFVFTRTLAARRFSDWSATERLEADLEEDEDLRQALDDERDLSPEQWARAVALVRGAYCDAARALARSALAGVYTRGEAELPVAAFERAVERVEAAVGGAISEERLRRLYALLQSTGEGSDDEVDIPPELDFERVAREALRSALAAALLDTGLAEGARHAVAESLEWSFTAIDQSSDLGDETLRLKLALPGRIVDGNFDRLEDGRALWTLEGAELRDREVVWRAVSVLE